jgi:hypothetical protein
MAIGRLTTPRALALALVLAAVAASTFGAASAAAATTRPAVQALSVGPATLPSQGGTVRLTARVRNARGCTFRGQSSPLASVRILKSVSCAAGRATMTVVVGPNPRTSAQRLRFSLTAADTHGHKAVRTVSLVEAGAPAPLVATGTLPAATVGQPYTATLAASGGTPAYTWAVSGGALPAGLNLAANGQITGTPTAPAGSSFTVTVTDAGQPVAQTATQAVSLQVVGGAPILTTAQAPSYSTNWSGYSEDGIFTGVTGTFNVPTLTASSPRADVSEWVGIDGAAQTDTSVIQAGVDETWAPGAAAPTVYAWWETFPAPGVNIPLPVAAGDRVSVTIGVIGGGVWRIQITDLTNSQTFSIDQPYSGPAHTAEWIVETPTDLDTNTLLGLPQYTPAVNFTSLFTAGAPTALTPITMVNSDGSQVLSVPSGISGAGFAVAYGSTPPPAP